MGGDGALVQFKGEFERLEEAKEAGKELLGNLTYDVDWKVDELFPNVLYIMVNDHQIEIHPL